MPIILFVALCLLGVASATPLPYHQVPLESRSSLSTSSPYEPAIASESASFLSISEHHRDSAVSPRFHAIWLRQQEGDDLVELYRRKGHPAAPAHTAPAHSAPPPPAKHAAPPAPKHESKHPPPPQHPSVAKAKAPNNAPAAPPHKKESLGHRIHEHFEHFKAAAKKAFKKIGEGIKTAVVKAGKFILKGAAVVNTWVGKAVGVVCKPAGRAIEAVASLQGAAADKLNKLDKHQSAKEREAFHGLDVGQRPMHYAAEAMIHKAEKTGNAAKIAAAKIGGAVLEHAI